MIQGLVELISDAVGSGDYEHIGTVISETMQREGFAKQTLIHQKLSKGEVGKIRIRK